MSEREEQNPYYLATGNPVLEQLIDEWNKAYAQQDIGMLRVCFHQLIGYAVAAKLEASQRWWQKLL